MFFYKELCIKFLKVFFVCLCIVSISIPSLSFDNQAFAESTQEKLDNAEAELNRVNAQLESVQAEIIDASAKLNETATQMDDVNNQIKQAQDKLAEKQEVLAKRVASKYRSGDSGIIDLVLSATDFFDLANNMYRMQKVMQSDSDLIDEVKQSKDELNAKKTELEDLQQVQAQNLSNLQDKQNKVTDMINNLNDEVKQLMEQRDAELVAAAAAAAASRQQGASSSSGGTYSGPKVPVAGSAKSQAIVDACYRTPFVGSGWCAAWVTNVYRNAGCGYIGGNANDMYWAYCHSNNRDELEPGMIIADYSHYGSGWEGIVYGHVGIYIGNGMVMSNESSIKVRSLDEFIRIFGNPNGVKWGWG